MVASRLSPFQREVLEAFFCKENRFFLTGGGALVGFHLGHRETDDLDLFATDDLIDAGAAALAAVGEGADVAAWLVTLPQRLSRRAAAAIRSAGDALAITSVRLMELAQMLAAGQIRPRGMPQAWLTDFVRETAVATAR